MKGYLIFLVKMRTEVQGALREAEKDSKDEEL